MSEPRINRSAACRARVVPLRRGARLPLVGALAAGLSALALAAPVAIAAKPSDAEIRKAAQVNGKTEAQIRKILTDHTAHLHPSGRMYYADQDLAGTSSPTVVPAPAYPLEETFKLHSRRDSERVIYLDFDGETITGTGWNGSYYGTPSSFYAEPYSLDATLDAFSTDEQSEIQSVWRRVAEDFAPFDVDVTTEDPGPAASDLDGLSDTVFGTRALITNTSQVRSGCGCDGYAFVDVFDSYVGHAWAQPAFVFSGPDVSAKSLADVASHEVGHNFGLHHDGPDYERGHEAWGPIMGSPSLRAITQWSKGEYAYASNHEDDLQTISDDGAPLLADDVGDTIAAARDLGPGPSVTSSGIVSTDADVDVFEVQTGAGPASFKVDPAPLGPNLDTRLTLLSASGAVLQQSDPPSAMSSPDIATGMNAAIDTVLATPGTYYLKVEGVGALNPLTTGYSGYASLGAYTLSATFSPPGMVSNDVFASALTLSGSTGTTSISNADATNEVGEPAHAGVAAAKSVWYRWTAPWSGTVTIDTAGSDFDTLLGVYTGATVDALTAVASNDNDAQATTSRVSFAVTAGAVYSIAVDGKGGAGGLLKLRWALPPTNDRFSNAAAISGFEATTTVLNSGATKEGGEPNHAGDTGGASIWYRWTAPATGTATFNTAGSTFDTLLGVYAGGSVATLATKAYNDNDGALTTSRVSVPVAAGSTYYIAVDGKAGASGSVKLGWRLPPVNDDFAAAMTITNAAGTITGTNVAATSQPGEPPHYASPSRSVWYRWVAPRGGWVTLDTAGSAIDTMLAAYTGTAIDQLAQLARNDDDGTLKTSRLTFQATAGTTYSIAIDGRAGATGALKLTWAMAPVNDPFDAATSISGAVGSIAATNALATKEPGEPDHAGNAGGRSVWYRWTAPWSATMTIDTGGSACDTLLGVYTGTSVGGLAPKASSDNDGALSSSRLSLTVTAGTVYFIAVDGKGGASGVLKLNWSLAPANDAFASATVLVGGAANFAGAGNVAATKQPGEPNHAGNAGGRSVWFTWTATLVGTVTIAIGSDATYDTLLAVYRGNSVDALTPVASNDDALPGVRYSQLTTFVWIGTTYRIAVDGYNGASGSATIMIIAV
jgi:hypothetical protein